MNNEISFYRNGVLELKLEKVQINSLRTGDLFFENFPERLALGGGTIECSIFGWPGTWWDGMYGYRILEIRRRKIPISSGEEIYIPLSSDFRHMKEVNYE